MLHAAQHCCFMRASWRFLVDASDGLAAGGARTVELYNCIDASTAEVVAAIGRHFDGSLKAHAAFVILA